MTGVQTCALPISGAREALAHAMAGQSAGQGADVQLTAGWTQVALTWRNFTPLRFAA